MFDRDGKYVENHLITVNTMRIFQRIHLLSRAEDGSDGPRRDEIEQGGGRGDDQHGGY